MGAGSALDLGTGGGEVLLELLDALPGDTVATEGWPPNIPVAASSLSAHGIPVVEYDAEADPLLPFPEHRFDVVLDRHEAYVAAEVLRVMRPGGRFLTQQVDGRNFPETQAMFGGQSNYPDITLANLSAEAVAAGFEVLAAEEWQGQSRFADVASCATSLTYRGRCRMTSASTGMPASYSTCITRGGSSPSPSGASTCPCSVQAERLRKRGQLEGRTRLRWTVQLLACGGCGRGAAVKDRQ